jgi:hypothetical protein
MRTISLEAQVLSVLELLNPENAHNDDVVEPVFHR